MILEVEISMWAIYDADIYVSQLWCRYLCEPIMMQISMWANYDADIYVSQLLCRYQCKPIMMQLLKGLLIRTWQIG